MDIEDLGRMAYREAWTVQEQRHADVLAGGRERLLLVEHAPVITFGRRPGVAVHLKASAERLTQLGVEVVQSDRGGDITFHGPGQVVAYPIVRLIDHHLSVSGYVHTLERIVIDTLAEFGVRARQDPAAVGVWVDVRQPPEKICAIGVRIHRGISLHGIALNVETDLDFFKLIVPCGLADRGVTSMRRELGDHTPSLDAVKAALARRMQATFSPVAQEK